MFICKGPDIGFYQKRRLSCNIDITLANRLYYVDQTLTFQLTGFDRMIIKGHILQLFSDSGKRYFLSQENVLLKDYGDYAEKVTKSIKANIEEMTSEFSGEVVSDIKKRPYGVRIKHRMN